MNKIKKIPLFKVRMEEGVIKPLKKVLYSGFIAEGEPVNKFEDKLREYIGNPYLLTISTGTHALELALRLANVGPEDEVISSPLTCTATNMPIMNGGAKIVWSDILGDNGNIDPDSIEKLITPKTKAILYVHWAGNPANIDAINKVAKKHNLKVIEDAAHAFGAEYKGKKIGNHSDFVMFSLQAIKHLTTGDGGILCCKNKQDFERGRSLRWFGIDREAVREELRWHYDIEEWGYKFNMNNIAATIGLENLKGLPNALKKHRRNGKFFNKELSSVPTIKILRQEKGANSVYWVYTLFAENREGLVKYLKENGIATSIIHTRNDIYSCFKEFKDDIPRPNLDKFTEKYVSIPCGWWVTREDAKFIVDKIKEFYENV